jgi:hypothetical protein
MPTRIEWLVVEPGVLALSGTPFQVRVETNGKDISDGTYRRVVHTYYGEQCIETCHYTATAKMVAEDRAIEMGLIKVD